MPACQGHELEQGMAGAQVLTCVGAGAPRLSMSLVAGAQDHICAVWEDTTASH